MEAAALIALAIEGVKLWNRVAEAAAAGNLQEAEEALAKARQHTQEADDKWRNAPGPG